MKVGGAAGLGAAAAQIRVRWAAVCAAVSTAASPQISGFSDRFIFKNRGFITKRAVSQRTDFRTNAGGLNRFTGRLQKRDVAPFYV